MTMFCPSRYPGGDARTRAPPGSWHRPSAVRVWRFWLDDRITRLESLRCSLRSSLGPRTEHAREPGEADRTPPRSSPPSQFAEINPPQRRRVLPSPIGESGGSLRGRARDIQEFGHQPSDLISRHEQTGEQDIDHFGVSHENSGG